MNDNSMKLNLLEKTEVRIFGLRLTSVNLDEVAATVAEVLDLPPDEVLVVDVRADHICLDLLVGSVEVHQITGREQKILEALRTLNGLEIDSDARIDSSGILGLIAVDEVLAGDIVKQSQKMSAEIEQNVLRRAIVFATGFEVKQKMIEDTNSPYLVDILNELGYQATFGGVLEDDVHVIACRLMDAVERGYGLIITTGGVGAEDKDFSIEALLRLDPHAMTPWIVKFEQGSGRHIKAGVRIGVGQYGLATFINLPGPHDEVVAAAAMLKEYCNATSIDRHKLAEGLAEVLRNKLSKRAQHWRHHN